MQKLRLRYAKRGKLRFMSHRDVARSFERAFRRAGVPMAHSQGFSPHPKISWVGAAPTGAASEAEYLEIQLVSEVDPDRLVRAVDAALPPGLDVLEAVVAGAGSLTDRIDGSRWRIEVPGVSPDELAAAVVRVLARDVIEVERLTKNGMRTIDVRPALISLQVGAGEDTATGVTPAEGTNGVQACGILEAVVRQTTPAVRPDDVLSAIRVVAALTPPVPAKATRTAQGRLDDDGGLVDPFVPDRGAVSVTVAGESEPGQPAVDRPAD